MGYTTEFKGRFKLEKKLEPAHHGTVKWRGEDFGDTGIIEVDNNVICVTES